MSSWRPKKCSRCGARADQGAVISKRGLCPECAHAAVVAAVHAMKDKRGEHFDRWKAAGGHLGSPGGAGGVVGSSTRQRVG